MGIETFIYCLLLLSALYWLDKVGVYCNAVLRRAVVRIVKGDRHDRVKRFKRFPAARLVAYPVFTPIIGPRHNTGAYMRLIVGPLSLVIGLVADPPSLVTLLLARGILRTSIAIPLHLYGIARPAPWAPLRCFGRFGVVLGFEMQFTDLWANPLIDYAIPNPFTFDRTAKRLKSDKIPLAIHQ